MYKVIDSGIICLGSNGNQVVVWRKFPVQAL